jgi:3-oxoadipate enol-lactonase
MQALTRPFGVLHVQVDGPRAAPPVVFANSLGTDLRLWDQVLPLLPGDCRFVVPWRRRDAGRSRR